MDRRMGEEELLTVKVLIPQNLLNNPQDVYTSQEMHPEHSRSNYSSRRLQRESRYLTPSLQCYYINILCKMNSGLY